MWSQWWVWPGLVSISVDSEFMSVPWQWILICLVDIRSDPCAKREKNPDRKEAFQLAMVTTNHSGGGKKKEWQLSCCHKLLRQLRMTISMFFLSRFLSLADSKGNTSQIWKKWRGFKEKGRLVKQHMAISLAFFGHDEPRHDGVIYISISSSSVPTRPKPHHRWTISRTGPVAEGRSPSSLWWCPADHNQTMPPPTPQVCVIIEKVFTVSVAVCSFCSWL